MFSPKKIEQSDAAAVTVVVHVAAVVVDGVDAAGVVHAVATTVVDGVAAVVVAAVAAVDVAAAVVVVAANLDLGQSKSSSSSLSNKTLKSWTKTLLMRSLFLLIGSPEKLFDPGFSLPSPLPLPANAPNFQQK